MTENGNRAGIVRMQEQTHDFALKKEKPSKGIVRIEKQEGNVRLRVSYENLQVLPGQMTYNMMILGRNAGASVYCVLGQLHVDASGSGSAVFEVSEQDVDGKGTPMKSFYIFMVTAMPQCRSRQPLQAVLKGDWDKTFACKGKVQKKTFNSYYLDYLQQSTEVLIAKGWELAETMPFEDKTPWRRNSSVRDFPVASKGAQKQVEKYGHFIFTFDRNNCVLGVPGKQNDVDQPDGGASGFRYWKPIKNSDEYGYWLVQIQRKTGIITEFP